MDAAKSNGASFVLRKPSGPQRTDWVWGGLGVGAAALSATFAVYMLTFGPAEPKLRDTPDFGVFAGLRPRSQATTADDAGRTKRTDRTAPTREAHDSSPGVDPRPGVDFMSTGSLANGETPPGGATSPLGKGAGSAPSTPIPAFVLRDVFDGKALVESRSALTLVAPGSVLDGAGEVLSIERRGDRWVVATTRGLIGAP